MMGSDTREDMNNTMLWKKIQMNTDLLMSHLGQLGGFNFTFDGLSWWMQPFADMSSSSFQDMSIDG